MKELTKNTTYQNCHQSYTTETDFVKFTPVRIRRHVIPRTCGYFANINKKIHFTRRLITSNFLGDLMHEEAILAWVLDLYVSTPDVIESVDRKTLQVLINDVDHLAVFFC